MTTPTPRTDAAEAAMTAYNGSIDRVTAKFARQLEDDLAAAQSELERVRDLCNVHFMAAAEAQEALKWYADEAKAIAKNLEAFKDGKDPAPILASLQVLALDNGRRAAIDAAREPK